MGAQAVTAELLPFPMRDPVVRSAGTLEPTRKRGHATPASLGELEVLGQAARCKNEGAAYFAHVPLSSASWEGHGLPTPVGPNWDPSIP